MSIPAHDHRFTDSISEIYERDLVPMLFAPYATVVAEQLRARNPTRLLEIAAGTGALTRALAESLPASCTIVATDLNPAMITRASSVGTARAVEWRQADALSLPFEDASFDAVVCQFGVMFFPDKVRGFAEARRVLRPGGVYMFSTWDTLETNEFAHVVTEAVAALFPEDPPRFVGRTPHGYHDCMQVERHLRAAGFDAPLRVETLEVRSRADSPRVPAVAFCQGTPLRNEIEQRDPTRLDEATDAATRALAARFGPHALDGLMRAHLITVER